MYNRAVVTMAILLMAGAVNAQYFEPHYSPPGTFGYADSQYAYDGAAAGFNYYGYMPAPVFHPSRPLADYGFAYSSPGLAPTYGPGMGIGSIALSVPSYVSPTYGGGFGLGSIALSVPSYVRPTYGPGMGIGSINLALGPHYIPDYGTPLTFGSAQYSLYRNVYVTPIYATPSRALFNTEFAFGTINRFY